MATKELAPSDYMALVRTVLAIDRSLMAWVRTALSLIGFGFSIFTFLHSLVSNGSLVLRESGPRNAGLILIGLGTLSLSFGMIEYWRAMAHFRQHYDMSPWRVPMFTSLVVCILGVAIFVLILTGESFL